MRIAFDLHGVLTESPHVMKPLLAMMKQNGTEIHILSGPTISQILAELKNFGYELGKHFDHVFSIVDTVKGKEVKTWKDSKDTYWCADEYWWPTKGKYCKEHWIDFIFDDSIGYKEFMPARTKFYLIGGKECEIDN